MEAKLGEPLASEREKYAVSVEFDRGVGVIGVGPITGSISKVEVEYGGQVVTQVPEGENFKLKVTYSAQNPGVGAVDYWLICLTAICTTDATLKGRENAIIGPGKTSVSNAVDRIEPLGPMPGADITMRVRLWGNQDISNPAAKPDESLW
jgi:hypothetical protein